jgi:hypothetical protein
VFAPDTLQYDDSWGAKAASWRAPDVPTVTFPYYSQSAGSVTVRIATQEGLAVRTLTHPADRGLNYVDYDLTVDPEQVEAFNAQVEDSESAADEPLALEPADDDAFYLLPGTYTVTVQRGGASAETTLTIEPSPPSAQAAPRMEPSGEEEIK